MLQKSTRFQRVAKLTQTRFNAIVPEKVHQALTEAVKGIVETCLVGSKWTTKPKETDDWSLQEKDKKAVDILQSYKRTAAVEGAGTGAGGIFLGMADFPLLLGIKMKFLHELASWYGFDTRRYDERLYILHLFELQFSSDTRRKELYPIVKNWDDHKEQIADTDWQVFQQEYRDYIDLVKLLQLMPGIGAVVGAYANYNLLEDLGKTAINGYRLRTMHAKTP